MLTLSDPLRMLLEHHRRFGPVFTIRHFHQAIVWAISPKATHQILVSDADAFSWRESRFGDLWPLLGDGFFAIDGEYHRQSRRLLLPAFSADAVKGVATRMVQEAVAAVDALQPSVRLDLNAWIRELAMRIAMRALAGIDAPSGDADTFAHEFERALSFHGNALPLQMLRGPRTPFAAMQQARRRLDALLEAEVTRRREAGDPGPGVIGMLLAATDGDGAPLPMGTVRDQTMSLLFAGHDTTTSTVSFMFYELARQPELLDRLLAER